MNESILQWKWRGLVRVLWWPGILRRSSAVRIDKLVSLQCHIVTSFQNRKWQVTLETFSQPIEGVKSVTLSVSFLKSRLEHFWWEDLPSLWTRRKRHGKKNDKAMSQTWSTAIEIIATSGFHSMKRKKTSFLRFCLKTYTYLSQRNQIHKIT